MFLAQNKAKNKKKFPEMFFLKELFMIDLITTIDRIIELARDPVHQLIILVVVNY